MSQIIVDEQLDPEEVLEPIRQWITAQWLPRLRPGEIIKDDRVPQLLWELRQPTFITIDAGFWDKSLCDNRYCILYFDLNTKQQALLPHMLRELFRLPEFRTKAARMGKVARIRFSRIDYWQLHNEQQIQLGW